MQISAAWFALAILCHGVLASCGSEPVVFTQGREQHSQRGEGRPLDADAVGADPDEAIVDRSDEPIDPGFSEAHTADEGSGFGQEPTTDGSSILGSEAKTPVVESAAPPAVDQVTNQQSEATDGADMSGAPPDRMDVTSEVLTITDIRDLCGRLPRQSRTVDVVFPSRIGSCTWNEDGNLDPVDGVVRARSEETVSLALQDQETLCGIRIESPEQEVIFDDELFLTFNDAVLLSSYDYNAHFSLEDGFFFYNWESLIGGYNPGQYPLLGSYCLGGDASAPSLCEVPSSESLGRFFLDVGGQEAEKLSFLAKQQKRADLGLIITGDDDQNDCSHSQITIGVELSTVSWPTTVTP
jgi:hypothetical protein